MFKNLITLSLLLLCIGCQKKMPQKLDKQILRINFCYQPFTVDPRKCSDPASCILNFMLYEGLTHLEPDGSISLSTAKSYSVSPDKKRYTFFLKKTFWSDGTPVSAYDFEASWKSLLDPNFPSTTAHLLYPIKNAKAARENKVSLEQVGIYAKDDKTLIIDLEKPTPYFLKLTSFCTYYPVPKEKTAMEMIWDEKSGDHLISNGPFRMKKWRRNDHIIVKKNSLFWNAKDVKLNRIFITLIQDESTAFKLYEQDKLDWIGGFISPIPLDALPSLISQKLIKHKQVAGTSFCAFNLNCFPFSNLNIRKAFSYAINRKEIIENISQMNEKAATSLVPPVLRGKKDLSFFSDYAPILAKEHFEKGLEELGLDRKDFPKLTYSYFASELQRNLAIILQQQWKEVLGISVDIQKRELKVFFDQLRKKNFEFAQVSWISQYFDQINILERFKHLDSCKNYPGFHDPEYTELLEESANQTNENRRQLLLERAEKILIAALPIAPMFYFNVSYLHKPYLKNFDISPIGDIQFRHAYKD